MQQFAVSPSETTDQRERGCGQTQAFDKLSGEKVAPECKSGQRKYFSALPTS